MIPSFILNNIVNPIKREINNFKESLYKDLNSREFNEKFYITGMNDYGNILYFYAIKKIYIEPNGQVYVKPCDVQINDSDRLALVVNCIENSLPVLGWEVNSEGITQNLTKLSIYDYIDYNNESNKFYFSYDGTILIKTNDYIDFPELLESLPDYEYNNDYKCICQIPVSLFTKEFYLDNYIEPGVDVDKRLLGYKAESFDSGEPYIRGFKNYIGITQTMLNPIKMKETILYHNKETNEKVKRYEIDWDINKIYKQILNQ